MRFLYSFLYRFIFGFVFVSHVFIIWFDYVMEFLDFVHVEPMEYEDFWYLFSEEVIDNVEFEIYRLR